MNTAPELVTAQLLAVENVCKSFPKPDGGELLVLEHVNLTLKAGQIVGLLGRSGSGKSTLLRLIAGLDEPSSGALAFRGAPIAGCASGIAMVFQSFALFPWLTVYENVALGLEAQHMEKAAIRKRSLAAIDLIGLDGFESAYPRELSGGMRQRVGFARALVVEPDALLMDEPFSALDVLTAQNLRAELLRLWREKDFPTKAMLIVTHNIEEAVILADRIFVLGANPGRIRTEIDCTFPQPRHRHDESAGAALHGRRRDHAAVGTSSLRCFPAVEDDRQPHARRAGHNDARARRWDVRAQDAHAPAGA